MARATALAHSALCTLHSALLSLFLLLVSCDSNINDSLQSISSHKAEDHPPLQITKLDFSGRHDTITAHVNILNTFGEGYVSDLSQLSISVSEEMKTTGTQVANPPTSCDWKDVAQEMSTKHNIQILCLVDLTLPQELIDQQRMSIRLLSFIFNYKNMKVAFMYDGAMTEPVPLTNYALDKYFVHHPSSSTKLYRSIVKARDIMRGISDTKYKALIVMSDGATYDQEQIIDQEQFQFQEELTTPSRLDTINPVIINYINYDNPADDVENDARGVMMLLTANTKGVYQDKADIVEIKNSIKKAFGINTDDFVFLLLNQPEKIYYGRTRLLSIDVRNADGVVVHSNKFPFKLGSLFKPVIVGDTPLWIIAMRTVLLGLFLLLFTYITLQLIIPWFGWRRFKAKYVYTYTGDNMAINNHVVGDTCYACKDKFKPGDTIVAKCQHTTHLDCWQELGHHCPEYGRHCPQGSYYYNTRNLFDTHNAHPYALWIYCAILAAILSWAAFFVSPHLLPDILSTSDADTGSDVQLAIHIRCALLSFFMGGLYTLAFAFLALHSKPLAARITHSAVRALAAAVISSLAAVITCLTCFSFDLNNHPYIISTINIAAASAIIATLAVARTPIPVRYIVVVAAAVFGVVGINIIAFIYNIFGKEYHDALFSGMLFIAIAIALTIAHRLPRSERFYLAARGAIKPIDIALYKYFLADSNTVVTIGKSVDCDICLSWEIIAPVPPLQAQISYRDGRVFLKAVEPGVTINGKELPTDTPKPLYHGATFTIGNTAFTYIEKDI